MNTPGELHPTSMPGSDPAIIQHLLSYNTLLEQRRLPELDLVVIHCTELPSLELAREYGERIVHNAAGTGNSGHFYIDRDGSIHQWVELERVAHHVRGMNTRSVGIELVNSGRYPDWFRSDRQVMTEPYPDAQMEALGALLTRLALIIPSLAWIAGHEELDTELVPAADDPGRMIRRKVDPGSLFPWDRIASSVNWSRWDKEAVNG